jgi:chromosome segregation ATPase
MNNEEKILSILEIMQADISGLQEGQASMQADISALKEGQASMQADISALQEGQANLEEGLAEANQRFSRIADDLQSARNDLHKVYGIVIRMENEQGIVLKAFIDAQVGYGETHKQHEPRIIKLETEIDQLDSIIRVIKAENSLLESKNH